MMKVKIKNRWTRLVIHLADVPDHTPIDVKIRSALLDAVSKKIDLSGSDLRGSDLRGSNLSGSDLSGSDLRGSDLRGSDLSGSNLSGSDLSGSDLSDSDLSDSDLSDSDLSGSDLSDSDLSGSNLSGSDLRGSDLRGSDLRGSNLRGSNLSGSDLSDSDLSDSDLSDSDLSGSDLSDSDLSGSNLSGSNLSGSDLTPIKNDFFNVLLLAPFEIDGLESALRDGRVNGLTYEGDCACLVGTTANVAKKNYYALGELKPNASRPIEKFFLSINKGDTPENNQFSALVVQWIEEFKPLIASHVIAAKKA
jgi:uncharacterized protein YjbI with pentapeptide repeats